MVRAECITNEKLSLYDQALEYSDDLKAEINAEIEKTWEETIKSDIPDGTQNYNVFDQGSFQMTHLRSGNIKL